MKHPEGLEIAKKLVAKCDVLVENFAPGGMERLGLSYEEAIKINPGIIFASIFRKCQTKRFGLQDVQDTREQETFNTSSASTIRKYIGIFWD